MRHDLAYLKRLSDASDRVAVQGIKLLEDPNRAAQLADLRAYFLYLTLDALEDPKLARKLVGSFERLEARSETHRKFFFTLGQLLSVKREVRRLPGEEISRRAFERSFKRTAEELGL